MCKLSILLVAISAALGVANAVPALTNKKGEAALFGDHHQGFDLHNDYFYYNDAAVAEEYKRSKYTTTKITMAGQERDFSGRLVPASPYPFVAAQKCTFNMGSSSDRWDVKFNEFGYEFFGVYQGHKGDFVVNKLRANLLRKLANSVQDLLPILDEPSEDVTSKDYQKYVDTAKSEVVDAIVGVFMNVDTEIVGAMDDDDKTSADAAVAIVTEKYVIVANVGENRILSYDNRMTMVNLTDVPVEERLPNNVFGLGKSKFQPCNPHVRIIPRSVPSDDEEDDEPIEQQLILLETGSINKVLDDEKVFKHLLTSIKGIERNNPEKEQALFHHAATAVLETVDKSLNVVTDVIKRVGDPDHTMILISLTKNYNEIH